MLVAQRNKEVAEPCNTTAYMWHVLLPLFTGQNKSYDKLSINVAKMYNQFLKKEAINILKIIQFYESPYFGCKNLLPFFPPKAKYIYPFLK